jgi:hypothetical protein
LWPGPARPLRFLTGADYWVPAFAGTTAEGVWALSKKPTHQTFQHRALIAAPALPLVPANAVACLAGAAIVRANFRGAASMSPEDEQERARKDRRNERARKRYAEDPEYREHRSTYQREYKGKRKDQDNQRRKERRNSDPEFREKVIIQTKLRRWRGIYNIDGMTIERYEQMSARQGDACKICRREIPGEVLCLDHRHATGWVRGLLCRGCNIGLGGFNDNPFWLIRAAFYVTLSLIEENVSHLFARLWRLCRRAPDSEQFRSGPGT